MLKLLTIKGVIKLDATASLNIRPSKTQGRRVIVWL